MAAARAQPDLIFFNGIDGSTGQYDLPPMTAEQLARAILGRPAADPLDELRDKLQSDEGALESFYVFDLAATGWGAVFAEDGDPAVEEALAPLLALRQEQAGELFRVFRGPDGVRPGESKSAWLARHGMGPGAPVPQKVPEYLLLVGSPSAIPFRFQSQLDVQYAVGRLHFDTPQEYAHYAASVLRAERGQAAARPATAAFFGAVNGDDHATTQTAKNLVAPLRESMAGVAGWQTELLAGPEATKEALAGWLGGPQTPALLFSGTHGNKLPAGDGRQLRHQGALICSDWPGPHQWGGGPIPQEFFMAGEDLDDAADLSGQIAFFYACYGGGTPLTDEFARQGFSDRPARLADAPFLADLPRRMLGRPNGGALAVVSHVERVWNSSYQWPGAGLQTHVFENSLSKLMAGCDVGQAFDGFNRRYAELSTLLSDLIEEIDNGAEVDFQDLAFHWTANNDARGYIILGDPAARLAAE